MIYLESLIYVLIGLLLIVGVWVLIAKALSVIFNKYE